MKFLVCYDSSELSRLVVHETLRHAKLWKAEIEVVHAIKRDGPIEHKKLVKMEGELASVIAVLFKDTDIPYSVQMEVDDTDEGERILDLAKRKNVGMIFVGPKKRSKVGKLLFGSVAQQIILNAPCPVVTLSRRAKDWD